MVKQVCGERSEVENEREESLVSDMTRLMTALVEKFTPTEIFNSLINLMDIAFKSLDQLMIKHEETSTISQVICLCCLMFVKWPLITLFVLL
jgi:hypothetical protein